MTLVKEIGGRRVKMGLFLFAPVLFLILVFGVELDPDRPEITYTLAVALLMALWWITEIVPLAVTSLLRIRVAHRIPSEERYHRPERRDLTARSA